MTPVTSMNQTQPRDPMTTTMKMTRVSWMNPVMKTRMETRGKGRRKQVTGSSGCRSSLHKAKALRKMAKSQDTRLARVVNLCERPTDLRAKTDIYFVSNTDSKYPQKKVKKYKSGYHGDWVERTHINAEVNSDDGQAITVGDDFPHSLSSGVSVTSSSWPTTQPNSDDESVGGITDDAGEREEHGKLLGKAKCREILKSYYAGGSRALETGVSIATYYLGLLTHSIVSEQIHSLAHIVPTTSVTGFTSSHTSAQTQKTQKGDIRLINLPHHLQSNFTTKFTPRLYEFLGTLSAWEQPMDIDIKVLWKSIFPQEQRPDFGMMDGQIIMKLVMCS